MPILGNPILIGGGSGNPALPEITFDGTYEWSSDAGGWLLYLKTSGTLTFTELNSAAKGIDVFLLGGGGGGGATTAYDVSYDNSASGLISTNVQDAIDELVARQTKIIKTETSKQTKT